MKLDILAIGVHPDDVELGCSGTILNEIKNGKKVGILDLTQGELGSRGTIETRYNEAAAAAMILGVHLRENLKMADGFFKNDEEHQLKLIIAIRKYQPEILFTNALHDRHPDHGRASELTEDAAFLSGLVKIKRRIKIIWLPILARAEKRPMLPDIIFIASRAKAMQRAGFIHPCLLSWLKYDRKLITISTNGNK